MNRSADNLSHSYRFMVPMRAKMERTLPMNLPLESDVPLTLVLSPGGERKSQQQVSAGSSPLGGEGRVRGVFDCMDTAKHTCALA